MIDVFTVAAWVVVVCMSAYAVVLTYVGIRDLLVPDDYCDCEADDD